MIVSRKSYTSPGIDSCLYLSAKSLKVNPAVGAKNRVLTRSKTIHTPRLDPQAGHEAVKEHCGIVGIYSLKGEPVAERIVKGLSALQHRGQESWGIAIPGEPIVKGLGLIGMGAAANARKILRLAGNRGIGHVRYSTRGRTTLENASPIDIKGEFSIAQNGTVANTEDLTPLVTGEFPILDDSNDTRLAGYRLLQHYRREHDWTRAFSRLAKELSGSYCFMILTKEGEVLAARDEAGFRPLCIGYDEENKTHIIASESCALTALHADFVRTYSLVNWSASPGRESSRPGLQTRPATIIARSSTPTSPIPAPASRATMSTRLADSSAESSLASIRSRQTLSSRSQTLPGLPRSAILRRVASRWKRA